MGKCSSLPDGRLYTEKKVLHLDLLAIDRTDGEPVEIGGLLELSFDVQQVSLSPELGSGTVQVSHALASGSPRRTSVGE